MELNFEIESITKTGFLRPVDNHTFTVNKCEMINIRAASYG